MKYTISSSNKEISLSEIIPNIDEDYEKLVPDLKVLTNVLIQLCNIQEVNFLEIKNQKKNTVFNPSEEFDIKYSVLELLNTNLEYHNISKLKILLSRKDKVFIKENNNELEDENEFQKVTGLNCPDILFKIEV